MNRYIISVLLVLTLLGCSQLSLYTYDPVEFREAATLASTTDETKAACKSPEASTAVNFLALKFNAFNDYVNLSQENAEVKQAVTVLNLHMQQLNKAYKIGSPSVAYCEDKLMLVSTEMHNVARVIGSKSK